MGNRAKLAHDVATRYYVQGLTMEAISRQLHISRSSVSRILADARQRGLVRITVPPLPQGNDNISYRLGKLFGVRVHCVGVPESASELHRADQVARVAAEYLSQSVHPDEVLGLAWGNTIAQVVSHLPKCPQPNVTVVQLNGSGSDQLSETPYIGGILAAAANAFNAQIVPFAVPAFFDNPDTKRAMWQERVVKAVLQVQARTTLAVFGVGSISGEIISHVYSAGYLSRAERQEIIASNLVGDVCTVLLRADGTYKDVPLNERATGPTPAQLRRLPTRLCVVAGQAKAIPLLAALRARIPTDLIVDERTARTVYRLATAPGQSTAPAGSSKVSHHKRDGRSRDHCARATSRATTGTTAGATAITAPADNNPGDPTVQPAPMAPLGGK